MSGVQRLSWLCLLLSAAAPPLGAEELPCVEGAPLVASLRLEYAVTASRGPLSLSGDGTIDYHRSGNAYRLEGRLAALGIFEAHESSAGVVRPEGLVPRIYTQRSSRRPPRNVTFDWATQRVTFSQTGESEPTRPQMQDRLSLLMQLAWRHRREPDARKLELPVAGLRHASNFVFKVQGADAVVVPAGRYEAVRIERHKDDSDDSLEAWLAPSLCSLPVRVRFTDEKGLVIDQRLTAVRAP